MGGDDRSLVKNPMDVGQDVITNKVEVTLTDGWKWCQGQSA